MKYYRNELGHEIVILNGTSVLNRMPGEKGFCFMMAEKPGDDAKHYVEYMQEHAGFYSVDPGELRL